MYLYIFFSDQRVIDNIIYFDKDKVIKCFQLQGKCARNPRKSNVLDFNGHINCLSVISNENMHLKLSCNNNDAWFWKGKQIDSYMRQECNEKDISFSVVSLCRVHRNDVIKFKVQFDDVKDMMVRNDSLIEQRLFEFIHPNDIVEFVNFTVWDDDASFYKQVTSHFFLEKMVVSYDLNKKTKVFTSVAKLIKKW